MLSIAHRRIPEKLDCDRMARVVAGIDLVLQELVNK
jgi:hypothetical protein